jgi:hypothetical protein
MIPIAIQQNSPKRWFQAQAVHSYNHHHHHVVMAAVAVAEEMVISVECTMNKWERNRSGLACASNDRGKQQNISGYCSPFKIRTKTPSEHKAEGPYAHLIYGVARP